MVGEGGIIGHGFVGGSMHIKEGHIALIDPGIVDHRAPKIHDSMDFGRKSFVARSPLHQAVFRDINKAGHFFLIQIGRL